VTHKALKVGLYFLFSGSKIGAGFRSRSSSAYRR